MGATTHHDRLSRLRIGQANRLERAQLLAALRDRQLNAAALVLDPPVCIQTMFTFDLLREVPGVGDVRLREINRRAIHDQINLAVAVGELTPLRRQWLADVLQNRRGRPRTLPEGRWPLSNRPQG